MLHRVRKGAAPSALLADHLVTEECVSGSPLVMGNKVDLLSSGPETYDAMLDAITQARRSVYLESYILESDSIGARFAAALIDRSRAGVVVALMVDAIGTLSTADTYFDELRKAGVHVVFFNPINPFGIHSEWSPNERNHRKVLITDSCVGFTGGFNLSEVYSSRPGRSGAKHRQVAFKHAPWRDTHIRIQGPAALELQREFLQGWKDQGGSPLPSASAFVGDVMREPAGDDVVRIITSSPADVCGIYWTLISAISKSQRSVHITMAYFVPDPTFLEALKDAARRGVDVTLVLPGFSDFWMVFHAGRSHYAELLESNVRIFERRDAFLHAKTAVIDGVWSTVGSSNMDWRSFVHNHELNAVVLGHAFGQEMENLFEKDCNDSVRIQVAEWQRRSWTFRLREYVSLLFEYWL
ncbi:MAG TPA: phospholipase D-like domain-containing protein [Rhodocyclaceae bacterium]|nr:phospholipase D-like domain-containing protein [Rhodocyclaceae bacterium]